ncbi:MAG: NUDIX hydrolase [Gemmataceae bacterium]
MRDHGPWKILQRHDVYQSPWTQIFRDDVLRPDGRRGSHDVVFLREGVTAVAVDDRMQVHLTEEFHYAVGRVTIEGVSGGRDRNEPPLDCAQREMREELGIEAEDWLHLGPMDPITSVVASVTHLYLARRLRFGDKTPEGTELIRHVVLPLAEALALVMDGRITHAATCVALLKTARILNV